MAVPLFVYASLGVLAFALFRERRTFEWVAAVIAVGGLLLSFALVTPVHQLFFDEDIYIHLASNLSHAPVAQLTLLGHSGDSRYSGYFKNPAGFPVLLSLVFIFTGTSEAVAFVVARVIFALFVACVYQFARRIGLERRQCITAAVIVAAVPVCFRFSVSAGSDLTAALYAVLGMWGIVARNGPLAAAGFALAAQTRLELIALVPLVYFTNAIQERWKLVGLGLIVPELLHVAWVLSSAPAFAAFESVPSAFGFANLWPNLQADLAFFMDPLRFPFLVVPFCLWVCVRRINPHLVFWIVVLLAIYLVFYAGNLSLTPRYSIQILAPVIVLAASVARHRYAIGALLVASALAFSQWPNGPEHVPALIEDHMLAARLASTAAPDDLIVTTEPEVFFNNGATAMSAFYAHANKEVLDDQFAHYRRILYYAGAQTNVVNGPEWRVDQWIKSLYTLDLIESRNVGDIWIAYFELSTQPRDRNREEGARSGSERDRS